MARSGRSRRATTKGRGRRTAATSSKFSPAVTRCGTRRRASVSRHVAFVLGLGLAAGCALKGDVRKVELQVAALKADAARADADPAAQIDSVLKLLAAVQQAVPAQQAYLVQFRGDVRTDLVGVQQQLVTVQELTGQSQQRLSELRARIEARAQQPVSPLGTSAVRAPGGPSGNPAGPGPAHMYDLSLQQFRRGRLGTATLGVREFLRGYAGDARAAGARCCIAGHL